MSRQLTTKNDKWAISPQQQTAIDLLVMGKTVTEVAQEIAVVRQTVSEWLHHHVGFQAQMNARRRELWQISSLRLQKLVHKSLEVMEAELESGENKLKAATIILEMVSNVSSYQHYGQQFPIKPEEIERVQTDIEQEQKVVAEENEVKRMERLNHANLAKVMGSRNMF